jgi:hypothetical protein
VLAIGWEGICVLTFGSFVRRSVVERICSPTIVAAVSLTSPLRTLSPAVGRSRVTPTWCVAGSVRGHPGQAWSEQQ